MSSYNQVTITTNILSRSSILDTGASIRPTPLYYMDIQCFSEKLLVELVKAKTHTITHFWMESLKKICLNNHVGKLCAWSNPVLPFSLSGLVILWLVPCHPRGTWSFSSSLTPSTDLASGNGILMIHLFWMSITLSCRRLGFLKGKKGHALFVLISVLITTYAPRPASALVRVSLLRPTLIGIIARML